jgi:hypothetical protein
MIKLCEIVAENEYEQQLRSLVNDNTNELHSFIAGNNKEHVDVDPDERYVLPNFRYKRISDKNSFNKYPDIVFTFNFLIPYLTEMNRKQITLDSIKHLRAYQIDSKMMLYRFQNFSFDDEVKKTLSKVNVGKDKLNTLKIATPHIKMCGFTRSAKTAQKAIVGSGTFGEREGYVYKKALQPILDIQKYSEMVLKSFSAVFGKIPESLEPISTFGVHEDEILAEQPEMQLDIENDVLLFAIGGKWFSPKEIFHSIKQESELETKSVMILVNYFDTWEQKLQVKELRISQETYNNICKWFTDPKTKEQEYMSVGGRTGIDLKASIKKKNIDYKYEPMLKKDCGAEVYISKW